MRQGEIAKWLKGITVVIAVMGAVFFLGLLPMLGKEMAVLYPEAAWLYVPALLYGWCIALFCYAILYQFWKVCVEIGKDNSFSMENANAFKNISRIALMLGVIWFLGIVILAVIGLGHPGILLIMLALVIIHMIIAVLAAALSHLILKAYEMKQETELTI